MLRHSGRASKIAWFGGEQASGGRTDHRSLESLATEDLKTVGGPSPRQASWHELFSKFDLHVVYTPGPVNPVGDSLSRWAYPANPAFGYVSIHGTAQAAGDVQDMMAAEEEELLARPPLLLGLKRRLGLKGRPRVIHPLWLQLQWGGGRSKRESFGDWSELPR